MISKERILEEIKRVAEKLEVKDLSQKQFEMNSTIPIETVKYHLGSWDQALKQADLLQAPPEKDKPKPKPKKDSPEPSEVKTSPPIIESDEPSEVKTSPPINESDKPSEVKTSPPVNESEAITFEDTGKKSGRANDWELPIQGEEGNMDEQKIKFIPQIIKPKQAKIKPRTLGDPIQFRGMKFAPVDKKGVIFLFGMIASELGFIIESLSPEFPDCLARRCIDLENNQWEQTRIQFEYCCSEADVEKIQENGCDLIVCWLHDLKDCPAEILELKSEMDRFEDFSRE